MKISELVCRASGIEEKNATWSVDSGTARCEEMRAKCPISCEFNGRAVMARMAMPQEIHRPLTYNREKMRAHHALNFASGIIESRNRAFRGSRESYEN